MFEKYMEHFPLYHIEIEMKHLIIDLRSRSLHIKVMTISVNLEMIALILCGIKKSSVSQ